MELREWVLAELSDRKYEAAELAITHLLVGIQLKRVQLFGLSYIWLKFAAMWAGVGAGLTITEQRVKEKS